MNTLIMSVSAGGGHNVTAKAIQDIILENEPDSKIHISDAVKYISPVLDKVVIGTYLNSLRINPKAYDLFYSTLNSPNEGSSIPIVDKIEELAATRLLPLIREKGPDIILSTHAFTTNLLASLRINGHIDIPCLAIITDYGIHNATIHEGMDGFIVAHESLVPEVTKRGIPEDIVLPLGIPVRSSFKDSFDKEKTLGSLKLDTSLPTVVMAGGTLGLGHMKKILQELDSIQERFNIVVITSNNQKLYDETKDLALVSEKNIVPLKYCDFMDALLSSADLLVTKPGGLTVSEALVTGLPMAIFTAVGGQEAQNRKFLLRHGLALDIGKGSDSAQLIENLLFDEKKRSKMSKANKSFAKPDAAQNIYEHMAKLVEERGQLKDEVIISYDDRLDDSNLDKAMGFTEEFMEDLISVPFIGSVMEKVRDYYQKNDSERIYELSDDEVNEILSSKEHKVLKNMSMKELTGKFSLSLRKKDAEK